MYYVFLNRSFPFINRLKIRTTQILIIKHVQLIRALNVIRILIKEIVPNYI